MAKRKRLKLGLALGSGGARGWCHIGALRELDAMGVKPDVIAGASMGSLVGAIHAGGALDKLEEWALKLTARSFLGMVDIRLSNGGLVEGGEILKVIRKLDLPDKLEDFPIPVALVATDMSSGREVWLTKGPAAESVRASVALPGIISPFYLGERWLLDGGLTNPVPVSACRVLGADVVIAINPNGRFDGTFWAERERRTSALFEGWRDRLPEQLGGLFLSHEDAPAAPEYLDVLSAAIDIMTDHIRRSRLAGDPPHVLLDAHLAAMSVLEFHRAAEAIEEGRRVVRDNVEAIAGAAGL